MYNIFAQANILKETSVKSDNFFVGRRLNLLKATDPYRY